VTTNCTRRSRVALARLAIDDHAARLGLSVPTAARPGGDLWARSVDGFAWPAPAPLLRAADGWVHPGPPTAWSDFAAMVATLGAPPVAHGAAFPDLRDLAAEAVDAEAAAWALPAVAVRTGPAIPDRIPETVTPDLCGATVLVVGTAWATPLAGHVLARLGARVVKIEHPSRPDPFPLRGRLVLGQRRRFLDLGDERDRDRLAGLLDGADLLVLGHPPRVLANAGLTPGCSVVRVAAFADGDRPGYGPAAEARGGWAARHDPPRLARTSVADPVAGLIAAITAVDVLARHPAGSRARVSLEGAVGHLLERERRGD
jgi:hypothetical protein